MSLDDKRLVPQLTADSDATLKEHMSRYQFACDQIKGGRVLDIACGVGYGTYMLSKVNKEAIGADISYEAIEHASHNYKSPNLVYKIVDAINIDFPDAYFDAIVSLETIPSIQDYKRFLKEVHRVLKPGGILILSTPTSDTVPKGKKAHVWYHIHEFTAGEMAGLIAPLFINIKIWQQKLGYYSWFYKRLKLILRHFPQGLLMRLSETMEQRSKDLSRLSAFSRIIIFETRHKYSILPYFSQGPKIRPTFLIFTCNKQSAK